jgi:hypothetical protein
MHSIRLGNVVIDGEVFGNGWKMAIELKTPRDDITRGIGQLAEALAYGYDKAALVTTLSKAKRINRTVFEKAGFILLAVDSKGRVTNRFTSHTATHCFIGQKQMENNNSKPQEP